MALLRKKPKEIPSDALILSEEEALEYQTKIIRNWRHTKDIWGYKYGPAILTACTAIGGIYINSHYRMRLKLLDYGKVSSFLPVCGIPAVLSLLTHTQFVMPDVTLQKNCPMCLELRSAACQSTFGIILPVFMSSFANFSLALRYNTYDIPYLTSEPRKAFQLWLKHTKPIKYALCGIFLAQALAGSLVVYLEARSVNTVNRKLATLERELELAGTSS